MKKTMMMVRNDQRTQLQCCDVKLESTWGAPCWRQRDRKKKLVIQQQPIEWYVLCFKRFLKIFSFSFSSSLAMLFGSSSSCLWFFVFLVFGVCFPPTSPTWLLDWLLLLVAALCKRIFFLQADFLYYYSSLPPRLLFSTTHFESSAALQLGSCLSWLIIWRRNRIWSLRAALTTAVEMSCGIIFCVMLFFSYSLLFSVGSSSSARRYFYFSEVYRESWEMVIMSAGDGHRAEHRDGWGGSEWMMSVGSELRWKELKIPDSSLVSTHRINFLYFYLIWYFCMLSDNWLDNVWSDILRGSLSNEMCLMFVQHSTITHHTTTSSTCLGLKRSETICETHSEIQDALTPLLADSLCSSA